MTIAELLKEKNQKLTKIEQTLNEKKFFDAVKHGNRDVIRQLVNTGIDVNIKDSDGWTALMLATFYGDNDKTVRLLIELGAELDVQNDDGETALMRTAIVNATNSAKLLISNGANLNIKDNNGKTALMMAIKEKSSEIQDMIVANETKKNSIKNEEKNEGGLNQKTKNESTENIAHEENKNIIMQKIDTSDSDLSNTEFENKKKQTRQFEPKENEVRDFFIKEFNTAFGTILDIRKLQENYLKRFSSSFNNNDLQKEIEINNSKNKIKNIENMGNGFYRVIPTRESLKQFFLSEFNKYIGYKTNIETRFVEKFNCNLADCCSLELTIEYFNKELNNKKIVLLYDKIIQILPSDDEVQKFLSLEFDKKYGTIIKKSYLYNKYYEKYKSSLDNEDLLHKIDIYNQANQFKKIIKLDGDRLKVIPTKKELKDFFIDQFNNTNYGYVTEIKAKLLGAYVDGELTNDFLDEVIFDFNSQNKNRRILKYDDDYIQIIPSADEIQTFLYAEFKNKQCGYISEIKVKFNERYSYELSNETLGNFINAFNSKVSEKQLMQLDNNCVQVIPSADVIQNFLYTELKNEQYGCISAIKVKFNKKYGCQLGDSKLNAAIKNFNNQSHDLVLKKIGNDRLQVLSKFFHNLSTAIQKKFLSEKIMFSCSINELIEVLKNEYNFHDLSNCDIISAIQIANSNLKDITIVENNNDIKSKFKCTDMSCSDFDLKICPVCGESFEQYSETQIKTHILELHTSRKQYDSIFMTKFRTFEEIFYCNHCKTEQALYDTEIGWIYRHLLGICKDFPTETSFPKHTQTNEKGIWKSFAYADNSSFLGNSGQLFRDNGRFGSYPIEDNYD